METEQTMLNAGAFRAIWLCVLALVDEILHLFGFLEQYDWRFRFCQYCHQDDWYAPIHVAKALEQATTKQLARAYGEREYDNLVAAEEWSGYLQHQLAGLLDHLRDNYVARVEERMGAHIDYVGAEVIAYLPFWLAQELDILDRELEVYQSGGTDESDWVVVTAAAAIHHWEGHALARICSTGIYRAGEHRIKTINPNPVVRHPKYTGRIGNDEAGAVIRRLQIILSYTGTMLFYRMNCRARVGVPREGYIKDLDWPGWEAE